MLELMQQRDYIDVIIPRGGEGLINFVSDNSKIPVIQHFKGVFIYTSIKMPIWILL